MWLRAVGIGGGLALGASVGSYSSSGKSLPVFELLVITLLAAAVVLLSDIGSMMVNQQLQQQTKTNEKKADEGQ